MKVGIYYQNGIYGLVEIKNQGKSCLIFLEKFNNGNIIPKNVRLYGGRVMVGYMEVNQWYLKVDGVNIVNVDINNPSLNIFLPVASIVSFLNAMETHGIDSFLEHYKLKIEELKNDLEALIQLKETQSMVEKNEKIVSKLIEQILKLREFYLVVFFFLFNMKIIMPAALNNEKMVASFKAFEGITN